MARITLQTTTVLMVAALTLARPTRRACAEELPRLRTGDVISLKCLGHIEGPRWLSVDPRSGSVTLAGNNCPDTTWVVKVVDGVMSLQHKPAGSPRWLEGNSLSGKVRLANGTKSSDTRWRLHPVEGGVRLNCLSPKGLRWYLDGNTVDGSVQLVSNPSELSGSRWEVVRPREVVSTPRAKAPLGKSADYVYDHRKRAYQRLDPKVDRRAVSQWNASINLADGSMHKGVFSRLDGGDYAISIPGGGPERIWSHEVIHIDAATGNKKYPITSWRVPSDTGRLRPYPQTKPSFVVKTSADTTREPPLVRTARQLIASEAVNILLFVHPQTRKIGGEYRGFNKTATGFKIDYRFEYTSAGNILGKALDRASRDPVRKEGGDFVSMEFHFDARGSFTRLGVGPDTGGVKAFVAFNRTAARAAINLLDKSMSSDLDTPEARRERRRRLEAKTNGKELTEEWIKWQQRRQAAWVASH